MKNKNIIMYIFSIILLIILSYINTNFLFLKVDKSKNQCIGIIDGELSNNYGESIVVNDGKIKSAVKTHGDELVIFLREYTPNIKIYYYNAADSEGIITSKKVLEGLNWMKEHNINKVNLSISSKVYSKEIQEWINLNKNSIQIYASYNNLLNTKDFPAMYDNVIASGANKKIKYKNIDKKYKTNNLIILGRLFKFNKGNSFLSLITLIEQLE